MSGFGNYKAETRLKKRNSQYFVYLSISLAAREVPFSLHPSFTYSLPPSSVKSTYSSTVVSWQSNPSYWLISLHRSPHFLFLSAISDYNIWNYRFYTFCTCLLHTHQAIVTVFANYEISTLHPCSNARRNSNTSHQVGVISWQNCQTLNEFCGVLQTTEIMSPLLLRWRDEAECSSVSRCQSLFKSPRSYHAGAQIWDLDGICSAVYNVVEHIQDPWTAWIRWAGLLTTAFRTI